MRKLSGLKKTASALNRNVKLQEATLKTAFASAPLVLGAPLLKVTPFEKYAHPLMGAGLGATVGAMLAVRPLKMNEARLLAKCIGKPRAAKELAEGVKSSYQKHMLLIFGHGTFNLSERESIKHLLQGNPTQMELNMALRSLEREETKLRERGIVSPDEHFT